MKTNKSRWKLRFSYLKLDHNSAQWMPKLLNIDDQNHAGLTSQSLRATIGPLQGNRPLFHFVIGISGIFSRSLDIFSHLHSTFARLYNAAASPASRLRSAGSLAIMRRFLGFLSFFESSTTLKVNEQPSIGRSQTLSWCCTWSIWRINWSTGFGCTYRCCRYCKLVDCSGAGGVFWAAQYSDMLRWWGEDADLYESKLFRYIQVCT